MVPLFPSLEMRQPAYDSELPEFLHVTYCPPGKPFHQMVLIALFLSHALGHLSMIILSTRSIFRNIPYRHKGMYLAIIICFTIEMLNLLRPYPSILVGDRIGRDQVRDLFAHFDETAQLVSVTYSQGRAVDLAPGVRCSTHRMSFVCSAMSKSHSLMAGRKTSFQVLGSL
jgi:hypothetical protein